MELKRILARDTRSATEQAMALYGRDVLIISNHRVGGQTELVIALDVVAAAEEVDAVEVLALVQGVAKGADAFDLRGEIALRDDCLFCVLLELQTGEKGVLFGVGQEG